LTARYRRPLIGSTTSCTQAPWRSVSLPLTGKAHAVPPHAARNWLCSPKRLLGGGRGGIDRPVDLRCADRNINPAPARKLQRDRQNILLRDVAICAHHVAQCHRGPCTTSARESRPPPPGRSSPGTRFRVERHEQACAPRRAGSVHPVPGFRNAQRAGFACIDRTVRSCAVRSGAARCQSGAPPCLVCIACFARILALLAPKTLFPCF